MTIGQNNLSKKKEQTSFAEILSDVGLLGVKFIVLFPWEFQLFEVTPTIFWLKCKNLPKCTKFCSTHKWEVAAKNFGLLTKNCLMHWQIRGPKGSISGNFCVVCLNL